MTKPITKHQRRVLAAMLAMEEAHDWPWWTRDAIGHVVRAGGYHDTIQIATIAILKRAGLIQSERSSWPPDVARRVRCGCACHNWGLTAAGREFALSLNIRWPEDSLRRLAQLTRHACFEDEVEFHDRIKAIAELDDDDDSADFWKRNQ